MEIEKTEVLEGQMIISDFLKPRVMFIKDCTDVNKHFKVGSEFDLLKESKEHFTFIFNNVYWSMYKDEMKVV